LISKIVYILIYVCGYLKPVGTHFLSFCDDQSLDLCGYGWCVLRSFCDYASFYLCFCFVYLELCVLCDFCFSVYFWSVIFVGAFVFSGQAKVLSC